MNTKIIIKIIGWAWVCFGLVSFFAGVLSFLLDSFRHPSLTIPIHSTVLSLIYLLFDVFTVLSGYMLLRLRPWARISIQAISAIYLFLFIKSGVHGFQVQLHDQILPEAIKIFFVCFGILVCIIWSSVFLASFLSLNLQRVKLEFETSKASHA